MTGGPRCFSHIKRKREFDAFVLYHFDADNDFVINYLNPGLREARHLKLNIHSRNFEVHNNDKS